jgi:Na+/phosphate symporter
LIHQFYFANFFNIFLATNGFHFAKNPFSFIIKSEKSEVDEMKKFTSGFFAGTFATIAATVGVVSAIKKTVIEPIEKKEAMIEANRRKANRKSRAR